MSLHYVRIAFAFLSLACVLFTVVRLCHVALCVCFLIHAIYLCLILCVCFFIYMYATCLCSICHVYAFSFTVKLGYNEFQGTGKLASL